MTSASFKDELLKCVKKNLFVNYSEVGKRDKYTQVLIISCLIMLYHHINSIAKQSRFIKHYIIVREFCGREKPSEGRKYLHLVLSSLEKNIVCNEFHR